MKKTLKKLWSLLLLVLVCNIATGQKGKNARVSNDRQTLDHYRRQC